MTSPPASGTPRRTSVSRLSAAASTEGTHSPLGSSAVRQAWAVASLVIGSPSRAADAGGALGVGDERDGRGVGTKRGAGEGEPARCRLEGLSDRVAPGEVV